MLGSRKRKRRYLWLLLPLVIIVGLAIAGWSVRRSYMQAITARDPAIKQNSVVTVKTGATVQEVAQELESRQIIKKAWAFEWYIRSRNVRDKLQAGSFPLSPSMSVQEIVSTITQGKVATDLFTILPAQRLDQVESAFVKAGYTQDDVVKAFAPSLYADHPALTDKPKDASLEGYLYPESFQRTADTTAQTIVRASLDEMARALTPGVRAGITKQGITVHQGVVLASIVEKEVSSTNERAMAAQVFLLRIKKGIPLGSDVTAYYGADIVGLTHSVVTDTPYNTRIHAGLPPGPVGNVSSSSLKAVASPTNTDYLFFVSGDDGITRFSHTQKEHESLTKQYCKKLCAQQDNL